MKSKSLDHFFYPKSVAVVGASADPGKAGYQIVRNLLDLQFSGSVYPVNPKLDELFGIKCFPDLAAIPEVVEQIVVSVPAFAVPEVFEQAAGRGDVKAAVIIASGFSETKEPERVELEKRVLAIARKAGIRVIGPNCIGVMNTKNNLDTSFAAGIRQVRGGMSIISQSGALGAAIGMFATNQAVPIGFAKWAHVGNQADVDVLEVMEYYRDDPDTKAIAMYMEGINNARQFLEVAQSICQEKPVIILKVGRSEVGQGAAASHTGSLAGSDNIYQAAFKQAGILRVNTVEELLDAAKAISMQPLPQGNRVVVLTEAGGPGIIAMDELGLSPDITLAKLSSETKQQLKEILPPMAIVDHTEGYVDMSAAADEKQHADALRCVLADPGVDGVVHLSVPPTFLQPKKMGELTAEVVSACNKPVTICYLAGDWVQPAREALEKCGVPTFDMPERAARAMVNLVRRANLVQKAEEKTSLSVSGGEVPTGVSSIIKTVQTQRRAITEPEARAILEQYDVPFVPAELAQNQDQAVTIAEKLGYPVVLKVVSPQIIHKSDVGGVKVDLDSEHKVRSAFSEIVAKATANMPQAEIQGMLVSKNADAGTELIIGGMRDLQFGPVVMAGFGGIFVEVLKDVSFRVAPISEKEAHAMLRELKLYQLLTGARGQEKVDIDALASIIVRVGRALVDVPHIKEIDLNPVRAYRQGALALDARIII
jgi:acetyl coenzyme A synthetase (ADP forming)-like protein